MFQFEWNRLELPTNLICRGRSEKNVNEREHGMLCDMMKWGHGEMLRAWGRHPWCWLRLLNRYALDQESSAEKGSCSQTGLTGKLHSWKDNTLHYPPREPFKNCWGAQNPLYEALIWRILPNRCSDHGLLLSLCMGRISPLSSAETFHYDETQAHQLRSHKLTLSKWISSRERSLPNIVLIFFAAEKLHNRSN